MRNNGFKMHKSVWRASAPTLDVDVAVYRDNGRKYGFGTNSYNLAHRLAVAFDPTDFNFVQNTIHAAFDTDSFTVDDSITDAIEANLSWYDVIRKLDTDSLTLASVNRDASESDGYTARIIGEWFNRKGRMVGFRIEVTNVFGPVGLYDVAAKSGHVALKEYSLNVLYGTFVKKPLAAYALTEAEELTKAANTANTYHRVRYTFERCDVGEAV